MLLQTRERMTAQQLAAELKVSVRTIYRDIQELHTVGVPLYGEAGPVGGYQLLQGYRTQLTGLTFDEVESLFVAGLPGFASDLGMGSAAASMQLKLLAALPPELRRRVGQTPAWFHLDVLGWYRHPERTPHLATIVQAIREARMVQMIYGRWKEPKVVSQTACPHGLVLKNGQWYLVAGKREGLLTFRVARITDLRLLDERSSHPDDFDLAAYWKSYLREFEERRFKAEAQLRVTLGGARRLADDLGPTVADAIDRTARPADEPGWILAEVPIESVEQAVEELLRFGSDVIVLGPADLRNRIAQEVKSLARTYGSLAVS